MHNYRMFIASAVALLGLLTATSVLGYSPDDMHWLIAPCSTVTSSTAQHLAGILDISGL